MLTQNQSNAPQTVLRKKKNSRNDGLNFKTVKNKYESEFKKRVAISNQQVKTKKCGGFVQIIQPVKTKNNIPFLIDDKKVKTLNRFLESSEPQVKISTAYL